MHSIKKNLLIQIPEIKPGESYIDTKNSFLDTKLMIDNN